MSEQGKVLLLAGLMLGNAGCGAVGTVERHGGEVSYDRDDEVVTVRLNDSEISDAGLGELTGLTSLKWLFLENTQITDAGLTHLQGMTRLIELNLNQTQITDAGLLHLKELPRLKKLDVSHTEVTRAGIEDLKEALPRCEVTAEGLDGEEATDAAGGPRASGSPYGR